MRCAIVVLSLAILLANHFAFADDAEQSLTLKDHVFTPTDLHIPAGKKIKLTIDNQDATPAEFESYELHREKIVPANSKITLYVGPLEPGQYPFFDDFHRDTVKGMITAE